MSTVHEAFVTADFDFVTFAMTLQNPAVELVRLQPIGTTGGPKRPVRYSFHLCGANNVDIRSKLEVLARDYANGKTTVDPCALFAKRRSLIGLMRNSNAGRKHREIGDA